MNSVLNFISGVNALIKAAELRNPDFYNSLCEFLVESFQLNSAIISKIITPGKAVVLGKSSTARRTFSLGSEITCAKCSHLNSPQKEFHILHTDKGCELNSTDFVLYEGCMLIQVNEIDSLFLKISKKSAFTSTDKEEIQTASRFVGNLLKGFYGSINNDVTTAKVVSTVANDFRSAANSIIGFVSMINDDRLNPAHTPYVNSIRESSQKLLALVNDVLEVARIETSAIKSNPTPVKLGSIIEEVIGIVKERPGAPVHFDSKVGSDLISIDSSIGKQVVSNILAFLRFYTKAGSVEVTLSHPSASVISALFTSSSLMLDTKTLAQLISLSEDGKDSGQEFPIAARLAIIIAKKYMAMLGGTLSLFGSREQGTVFEITFSLQTPKTLEQTITSLPKPGIKTKVLVIQDDYATSKLLSNYLTRWGYQPVVINSGLKALEMLEDDSFLAVITDIILPDINGLEFLQRVRENRKTKSVPVIVASVEAEQQKAFLMGAVEYFVKPISYKDLVEVLTSFKLKKNANILCVDDDLPTLNLVKDAIISAGFNPIAENFSAQVMQNVRYIDLDLAIVDLDMPEVSGFELIKMLKSDPKFANLPIVIYTGKENYEEDLAKIDGLFTELLSKKSTKLEDLADTISRMVNKYEEATPPEVAAQQSADTAKILLVEDYKHSQIIVTRLLKKNGFASVVVCENGAEAVEQATNQHFDLILMDMQMPVMNGFEATERIRQMAGYKDVPIIALTAFAMKGDREKCLEAGATDYIPKPIDSHDFIEKVKYYTSNKVKA